MPSKASQSSASLNSIVHSPNLAGPRRRGHAMRSKCCQDCSKTLCVRRNVPLESSHRTSSMQLTGPELNRASMMTFCAPAGKTDTAKAASAEPATTRSAKMRLTNLRGCEGAAADKARRSCTTRCEVLLPCLALCRLKQKEVTPSVFARYFTSCTCYYCYCGQTKYYLKLVLRRC